MSAEQRAVYDGQFHEAKPVAIKPTKTAKATKLSKKVAKKTQRAAVAEVTEKTKEEWVSAVGKINAGVTVYMQTYPDSEPDAWFTVIEPYLRDDDGTVTMKVKYAATGRVDYMDRRATMRSPAAMAGQLVIKKFQAR